MNYRDSICIKRARRYSDIIAFLGAPALIVAANIIGHRIAKYIMDERFVKRILAGQIREDTFVRNMTQLMVDDIDKAIRSGSLDTESEKAKQLLRGSLLKAKTIKDLLTLAPTNKMLQEADRLFTKAKAYGNLA